MHGLHRTLFLLCAAVLAGCGADYAPPALETTDNDAPRLGQVLDIDVVFPDMLQENARWPGASLQMRLEVEGTGVGQHTARAYYSDNVEDLSDGMTTLLATPGEWTLGLLGPLRIGGTTFEMLLRGTVDEQGWHVSGPAYETREATEGRFEGWRRHRFLVSGTDFFSEFGRVDLVEIVRGNQLMVRQGLELVSSDAVLRVSGTAVYAVNRFTFDNLQRLDPPEGFVTAWQIGVGSGANPQDIVMFDEDKGYVTRYEPPFDDVAVLDARTRRIVDSISLRGLAENPDATPRASRLTLAEGAVFVGLQDIDRTFSHFAEGKLAVIDPRLDEVAGVIPLGGKNPGQIEVLRGADGRVRLWVALGGIFAGLQDQELSGGVAVVDAFDRVFERMALDDDVAGGNIGALAMASERLGYVVVSDERFRNSVLAFDPQVSEVLRSVTESFYLIPELEVDSGGVLAVPDRDAFQPRLCLHRTPVADGETEISVGCARLTLPPFSIEALD